MAKKKQFVTAAAAFAVAASAVAPAITADAASTTVQLSSDYVRGGDLDAALDKEYKGSEIYWYKSSVDMNKLGVFQTAKGFVKGKGIRVEKKLRVLNHAQDIQPEEIVLEQGVPASGLRIQPVLFADGVKYNKVVTYAGFSTEKAGEFEGTFTYSNKAFGVVTKTVKYTVVNSAPKVEKAEAINSTQAVVAFDKEIGEVSASNFTANNGLAVIKAEVNGSNKNEVKLTFNDSFVDKEAYELSIEGVKSVQGVEMEEAAKTSFTYEVSEVSSVTLNSMKFNSTGSTGANAVNLLDSVTIKDEKGRDITSEVFENTTKYNVVVASTDNTVINNGLVVEDADGSAYVEIKVLNKLDGNKQLATSGAIKVEAAPYVAVSLDGVHIAAASVTAADYNTAKEDNEVKSSIELGMANDSGDAAQYLNIYAKDSEGNTIKLDATNATITNLTPTVATVSKSTDEFVIKTISTGTAQVKVKVGNFETTVSFTVKADAKVTDAKLSKTAATLTTDATSPANTDTIGLTLVDQYGEKIASNGSFEVVASKAGVVSGSGATGELQVDPASSGVTGEYEIPLTAATNGSTTLTVKYKDASGATVFTKTFTVAVKDFGAAAKYDLVVSPSSADYLDADVDGSETGIDAIDNSVEFKLYSVDASGNRVKEITLDGSTNNLVLDVAAMTDEEKALLSHTNGALAVDTLTFANPSLAAKTLTKSGNVKVVAKVGGVTVDTINVSYKNTDAVANKASIRSTSLVVDIDQVDSLTDLIFGVYGTSKYTVNPLLSIQDQFGGTMKYDVANSSTVGTAVDVLANGLTVVPNTTVTNKDGVTVDPTTGAIAFESGKTAGSFTLVIADVNTNDGTSDVNEDLLASPIAIKVNVVK